MITAGINQPYYLPYIGFFERMKACDYFVINPFAPLNAVKSFHRRVKIIQQHPEAEQNFLYLTECLSLRMDGVVFNEISLNNQFWKRQEKHAKTIYNTYRRSPFFDYLRDLLDLLIDRDPKDLGSYDTKLIKFLAMKLGIKSHIVDANKDKRLLKIRSRELPEGFKNKGTYTSYVVCKALKAQLHLVGQNGPLWLDEELLNFHKIDTLYQRIKFKPYRQFPKRSVFIPGLSIIDLIFNYGPGATKILGLNSKFVSRNTLLKTIKLTGR